MIDKDIQIICQNANTAAATMVAGLPLSTLDEAIEAYAALYELTVSTVFARIGEEVIGQHMPGGETAPATPAPAPAPAAPQTGPGNVGAPAGFPQATGGPVPPPAPFDPNTQVAGGGAAQQPQSTNPAHADWMSVLQSQGGEWYDNRFDKRSAKGPDFRHKTRMAPDGKYKLGLWLRDCPPELRPNIDAMPAF